MQRAQDRLGLVFPAGYADDLGDAPQVGKLDPDPHKATTVAVGEGTIDWKKVIGTAHANGVKHYFYEQEPPYTRPILDSARISADYLSKLTV